MTINPSSGGTRLLLRSWVHAHPRLEISDMTNTPDPKDTKKSPPHPGMMGDGTEEQNLGQPGNPAARIKKNEVDAAFAKDTKKT
jgi:hypothetical protein